MSRFVQSNIKKKACSRMICFVVYLHYKENTNTSKLRISSTTGLKPLGSWAAFKSSTECTTCLNDNAEWVPTIDTIDSNIFFCI